MPGLGNHPPFGIDSWAKASNYCTWAVQWRGRRANVHRDKLAILPGGSPSISRLISFQPLSTTIFNPTLSIALPTTPKTSSPSFSLHFHVITSRHLQGLHPTGHSLFYYICVELAGHQRR